MRKAEAHIGTKTYLMVLSLNTMMVAAERGVDLEKMRRSDGGELKALDMVPVITAMINSGSAYSHETGGPEYPTITEERLSILVGLEELQYLQTLIVSLFQGDRNIDAVQTKNAGTTPAGPTA